MKKVLIVEDDPIIAHIYRTRVEKEGYKVEVAADGQSGFYRIHEFEPDAILLDLMLPKMNGVEILKKIRAEARFAQTPVIVFTNSYVPNMINESFLAGATLVFNKATVTPRQLIDSLYNVIYSAIPADGTPPKATQHSEPALSQAPEPEHFLATVGSEGAFHSTPPSLSKAEAPATQSSYQTASAVVASPATVDAEDSEAQAELLKSFLEGVKATLIQLRKLTQEFSKAQDETSRLAHLLELYRKVHALTGSAGIAGARNIAKMAAAVEVLLKELHEKPKNLNASTMRTVAHSIDFLAELCAKGIKGDLIDQNPIKILVVDDEILSRRAITYALEKAGLKSASVEEPHVALTLAGETSFDLIFLDVQMPGMDGFDLCTKIRALATNKKTPIIFVTSLTDFKSRAKSTLSGGADLIAKPFMFIELTVKALTYVLRGQLMRLQNR
jgi:DNA-binding response OmpR family regulator/HPt (histidine-containing phosphotransfer) domain-containing protein